MNLSFSTPPRSIFLRKYILLVFLIGVSSNAFADCFADFKQSKDEKQLVVCVEKQGGVDAQRMLGFVYFNGLGVTKDYENALIWFKKAAEQGDSIAQRC